MTNSELKQELLRALSELVDHCPDVRFGQLIVNLSCIARGPTPEAIWDMETMSFSPPRGAISRTTSGDMRGRP
jgi:hypothetical protein